jgi:CheY-like chemotaxis protein
MSAIPNEIPAGQDLPWFVTGHGTRFQGFQNLMRFTVSDILLVSSLYDFYILVEDGRLYESIRKEYEGLNISRSPEITHASTGADALRHLAGGRRFDLIITTLHIEDMHPTRFAEQVRGAGMTMPIVLLAYDNREQSELILHHDTSVFDILFLWQGDFHMLLGIIKCVEDRINAEHDTRTFGVQVIILIEDDVRSYSSFVPIIYSEILKQSQRLLAEGINLFDKYQRMRARPKILLCTTYEEGWATYEHHADYVLGIISDIDLLHHHRRDPQAGIALARKVKVRHPDIPILLQSSDAGNEPEAHRTGSSFLLKDSPTLLHDLGQFMLQYFGFGEFIFRGSEGREVGRAHDLKSLEAQLRSVPEESIVYHAERNHFSNWLKARTEFSLAHSLRPRKVTDYPSPEALRRDLILSLESYRKSRQLGQIMDFDQSTFDATSSVARIGGGSLGGKARGLGFINSLLSNFEIRDRFPDVEISVPPAVVVGTDVFDQFLVSNNLREYALRATDDGEITRRFVAAKRFPRKARAHLGEFLELTPVPLAVRSSTLLEDSQYHPFAGVYATYMIPNNHPNPVVRLNNLISTIKRVYASTFYQSAKEYIKATSYRLEEEKMAVVVQTIVGAGHGSRYYPDVSGVARSYNFYPVPPQKAQDGTVTVALGLGRTIVEGGVALRFCPKYPKHILQFFSAQETLRSCQTEFYALDLAGGMLPPTATDDILLQKHTLDIAETDQTLQYVGSTYSPENDTVRDGVTANGVRLVTFAPILRHGILPLPEIVELLLELGSSGMGTPVEIEFAARMSVPTGHPIEFGLLQIRPLVLSSGLVELTPEEFDPAGLVCRSTRVLGNGVTGDIRDVVFVDSGRFERSKTAEVAAEVSSFNQRLVAERRPYLLIGFGRWGSLDPWLGIPVRWDQISGARAIIEAGFQDIAVEPSQGSHFFHNITSFMVGYFTVTQDSEEGFVDWEWLLRQSPLEAGSYTRHLRFDAPVTVKIDCRRNTGIIRKPGK